jgi:outer membrane protein
MKRIGLLAACVCLCAVAAARAQTVAVVDMEELVRLRPNTVSDKKLLDQTVKDYRAENEELRKKLEEHQADFEKVRKESQDPALSEKARKSAEERALKARDALIAADRTAREKAQSRQEDLSEMQTRMVKKTVSEIREVVTKYALEQKIQLVLPANQVVFNNPTFDITDAILKQMNIQRPAKTAAFAPENLRVKRATTDTPEAAAPVAAPATAPVTPK